ncbi:MAG: hypothetical protein ABH950_04070 [Candidatus Altiarchaeota archaeon]
MASEVLSRRYFLTAGLLGAFLLGYGYYLLWLKGDTRGWIFLILAVVNYLRVQRRIRNMD